VTVTGKPTPEELGIDVAAQRWQRSGAGDGTIEVAVVTGAGPVGGDGRCGGVGRSGSNMVSATPCQGGDLR